MCEVKNVFIRLAIYGIASLMLLASCNGNSATHTPTTSDGSLTFLDFNFLTLGMSYDEIIAIVGEADRDTGSGVHLLVYDLNDGTEMMLSFVSLDDLLAAYRYDPKKDIREVILGPD